MRGPQKCSRCGKAGHRRPTCPEMRQARIEERKRQEDAVNAFGDLLSTVADRAERRCLLMSAWDRATMAINREDWATAREIGTCLDGNIEARVRYHQDALVRLDEEQEERAEQAA